MHCYKKKISQRQKEEIERDIRKNREFSYLPQGKNIGYILLGSFNENWTENVIGFIGRDHVKIYDKDYRPENHKLHDHIKDLTDLCQRIIGPEQLTLKI